jgi:ligand-binding SRPBCC domain-containing protein
LWTAATAIAKALGISKVAALRYTGRATNATIRAASDPKESCLTEGSWYSVAMEALDQLDAEISPRIFARCIPQWTDQLLPNWMRREWENIDADHLHQAIDRSSPPEEVWEHATSPAGINEELSPWIKMTVPKAFGGRGISDVELGQRVGRSWFLLLGFMPFDYDDITIADREHARRFRETSSMLSIRHWEHERTLRPVAEGTEITDRITMEMRWPLSLVPGLQVLVARVLALLFHHRHRRLARRFRGGGLAATEAVGRVTCRPEAAD